MTNTTKTVTFFLVALLVLCGGVIASFATKASFANEQNQQLKRQIDDSKQYHIQLENCYEKAMFELADSLDNMQANLSKLHASNGRANQQLLLTKKLDKQSALQSFGNAEELLLFANHLTPKPNWLCKRKLGLLLMHTSLQQK